MEFLPSIKHTHIFFVQTGATHYKAEAKKFLLLSTQEQTADRLEATNFPYEGKLRTTCTDGIS
jgi:hypothetical protein